MTYHHFKHETCIVMDGTSMYNCPTFFLFWKCLDDMSYWTNLYRTVADNQLHFFTISNLNYTVFVSLAHNIMCIRGYVIHWLAFSFKSIGRWQHYLPKTICAYSLQCYTITSNGHTCTSLNTAQVTLSE